MKKLLLLVLLVFLPILIFILRYLFAIPSAEYSQGVGLFMCYFALYLIKFGKDFMDGGSPFWNIEGTGSGCMILIVGIITYLNGIIALLNIIEY